MNIQVIDNFQRTKIKNDNTNGWIEKWRDKSKISNQIRGILNDSDGES